MGSTNFQRFNPAGSSMLSDSDYTANTQRLNGVTPGIASSALHNKIFYQVSTMVAAIAEVMANSGETVTDASYSALVASITTVFTQRTIPQVVNKSSTGSAAGANDQGTLYVCTGTFSFTIDSAATLPNGWYVFLRNDGSGVITVDPDGSETINNASTVAFNPGDSALIIRSGSGSFKTIGLTIPGVLTKKALGLGPVTPSGGGTASLPHGLGTRPIIICPYAECTSAEGGYSVGEKVPLSPGMEMRAASTTHGVGFKPDATNLNLIFANDPNPLFIASRSTPGEQLNANNGKWNIYVDCYA